MSELLQKAFSASAEIQDLFLRAQKEETEQGSVSEETQTEIQRLSKERDFLLSELGKWFLWTDSKLQGLKAEYRPLMEAMEANVSELERRKDFIKTCMVRVFQPGKDSVIANESIYAYYKHSTKLHIESEEHIPLEYQKLEPVPDPAAIKAAIEKGEEVPGARIVENWNLQVKFGGESAIKNAKKLIKSRGENGREETI